MANNAGLMGSTMIVVSLIALVVIVILAVRYLRGRTRPSTMPQPELPLPSAEASLLDSSHIGGPIAGTEAFERFNPDKSKRRP